MIPHHHQLHANGHLRASILQPLYRTTCVSRHPQARTRGCFEQSFTARMPLLMTTSTFRLGDDSRVLLSSVTCTVSMPSTSKHRWFAGCNPDGLPVATQMVCRLQPRWFAGCLSLYLHSFCEQRHRLNAVPVIQPAVSKHRREQHRKKLSLIESRIHVTLDINRLTVWRQCR